jgi:hypothetical protein
MTAITATAHAKVTETGPWFRRRYTVRLFINEVNTGLHWHVKKRELKTVSRSVVDNAAELLVSMGLMDEVFDLVNAAERGLPPVGSKVELLKGFGPYATGTVGTVVAHSDYSDDEWPVYVALTAGNESDEIALSLSELKVAA